MPEYPGKITSRTTRYRAGREVTKTLTDEWGRSRSAAGREVANVTRKILPWARSGKKDDWEASKKACVSNLRSDFGKRLTPTQRTDHEATV